MTSGTDQINASQLKGSNYIIGIDVGTTAVKAILVDQSGLSCDLFSETYPKSFPQEGWVEQDPEQWVGLIYRAIEKFSNIVKLSEISAICVCSQVNTHVFVGKNKNALLPAIVWSDTRSKDKAAELDAQFSTDEKIEKWGFEFVLDSSYSLSRAAWVADHMPEIWAETDWIMSPKDYCNYVLSGVSASDAFSSVGLATGEGEYVQGLDALLDGFSSCLPPLKDMFEKIGVTNIKKFPDLKADMFTGTMDAWANFMGSGVVDNGRCALIGGTSSIVGIMSEEALPAKGVITFPPFQNRYLHAGPTQAGSDAFAWFAELSGKEIESFLDEIKNRQISSSSPLFLPHLQGERAPLWDPNARGTFIGLTGQHDIVDMGLAVIEGVAYSERHVFDVCCEAAGYTPSEIRFSGGASQNDYWTQIRANCLDVPLQRLDEVNSGVLGSAILAMVGAKIYPDIQKSAEIVVGLKDKFSPQSEKRALFKHRYQLYRDSYTQIKPIFDRLVTTAVN